MESSSHKDGGTILPGLGSLKLSPTSRGIKPNKGFKIFHTFFFGRGDKGRSLSKVACLFQVKFIFSIEYIFSE